MLNPSELATVRAALRFWADEMSPHDRQLAAPYFDAEPGELLDRAETILLRSRFLQSNVRYLQLTGSRQRRVVDCTIYSLDELPTDSAASWGTVILPPRGRR